MVHPEQRRLVMTVQKLDDLTTTETVRRVACLVDGDYVYWRARRGARRNIFGRARFPDGQWCIYPSVGTVPFDTALFKDDAPVGYMLGAKQLIVFSDTIMVVPVCCADVGNGRSSPNAHARAPTPNLQPSRNRL